MPFDAPPRRSADPPMRPSYLESLLFVVGHPLSHSLSPAMHGAVIRRRSLPLRYVGIEIPPDRFDDFIRVVRSANFKGGNVTVPYKGRAAEAADARSAAVDVCGAANVLTVKDGRLHADNTDGDGFLDAAAAAGWGRAFPRVVILGAGGAARGIAHALMGSGTREIVVLNRDRGKADRMADALSGRVPGVSFEAGPLEPRAMGRAFPGADLVVQCTTLGLTREWDDFPVKAVEKTTRFADIVYVPGGTALVRGLRRRGIDTMDGLPMLAFQAARSFGLWTGIEVPGDEYLAAARRAVARKR
jgi:shikimate dehydrogenase